MAITDFIASAISRPAGRVMDSPIRDIVNDVLRDRGYAGPDELRSLRDEAAGLRRQVSELGRRLDAAEGVAASLSERLQKLEAELDRAQAATAEARKRADEAEAHNELLEEALIEVKQDAVRAAELAALAEATAEEAEILAHRPDGMSAEEHADVVKNQDAGFVSPEGVVEVDGRPYRVSREYAGRAYKIAGGKARKVYIDGKAVKKEAL